MEVQIKIVLTLEEARVLKAVLEAPDLRFDSEWDEKVILKLHESLVNMGLPE